MISQAKASTAGSNRRQVGRGFTLLVAPAVLVCALALATLGSTAFASHPPEYQLEESFGPDGSGSSNFNFAASTAFDQVSDLLYVLDDGAGILYKFDSNGNPVNWGGSEPYIADNKINGITFPPVSEWEHQVAVDSTSHKVYVTDANSLRAFLPNGEPAVFTAGPGMGTSVIGGFSRIGGIATDAEGYIYASDREAGTVKVFKPSGEQVKAFSAANAANLAVDQTGAVYVNRRSSNVLKYSASALPPVTAATTYAPAPEPVNPSGSLTVAVDPATDNVYIAKSGGLGSPGVLVYDSDGELITTFGQTGSEGALVISRGVAIKASGGTTKAYVGNWASASDSQVRVFQLIPPPPIEAPTIEDLAIWDIGNASATLGARINPNSSPTVYHFEYGLAKCPSIACNSVPLGPAGIGDGHDLVSVSHEIAGLQGASTYHYRVFAENGEGSDEDSGLFRTQGSGLGFQLIDRRAWEMVSPPDKHGAVVHPAMNFGHFQAAADGNGLTYLTGGSIESDPAGSRSEPSTVLARRGAGGWSSLDLTPPNSRVVEVSVTDMSEYKLFNLDLSEALLAPRDGTGLSPEASERAPYWRQNSEPPVYRPLATGREGFANVPPGTEFGGPGAVSDVVITAATVDLDHVVVDSQAPLVVDAKISAVYRWHDGEFEPVSALPDGEGGEIVGGVVGAGELSSRHAISDDGSRVFWMSGFIGTEIVSLLHLYVRDTVADTTTRLDVAEPGGSGAGDSDPLFQGASADGSAVFFTDSAQLTADASPSGTDLYRCELPLGAPVTGCADLTDISAPLPGAGESADVLGVASALSEDGDTVYFVARGRLDTGPNQAGDTAAAGKPNLYVWQEGAGVRFIATLAENDRPDWGHGVNSPRVVDLSAFSSPSGRHFVFMSERSLTDEVNVDAAFEPVERIFRYDLLADRLDCVSCNPTGAGPDGVVIGKQEQRLLDPRRQWADRPVAATLPPSPRANLEGVLLYRTRAVHDNGRVFFNAVDALVPADSNGEWDVYQYEPTGAGSCDTSSGDAATARSAAGCLSLISSGTAEEAAGFFDASVGGDDVFFRTSARLSVLDQDAEHDIYDARVDGIAATLPLNTECLGEACQPAAQAPNDPTPASAAFKGAGNLAQLRDCGSISRRVGKLSRRAKGLRRKAKAARSPKASKRMRGKARRLSRKASGLGKQAKRCRRASRRAGR